MKLISIMTGIVGRWRVPINSVYNPATSTDLRIIIMMELIRRGLLVVCCIFASHTVFAGVHVLGLNDLLLPFPVGKGDQLVVPLTIPPHHFKVIWLTEEFASTKVFLEDPRGRILQNIKVRDFYLRRRVLLTHETCNPCQLRISVWTEHPERASIQAETETFSLLDNELRFVAEQKLQRIQRNIDASHKYLLPDLRILLNELSDIWRLLDEQKELINSHYLYVAYTEGKKNNSLQVFFTESNDNQLLELVYDYRNDPFLVLLKEQLTLARRRMDLFAIARINIAIGREAFSRGLYALAERYYYKHALSLVSMQAGDKHKTLYLFATIDHEFGQIDTKLALFSSAESYLDKSLLNFSKISDASLMADVINTQGFMNRLQDKLALAAAQHRVAFQLSEHTTDSVGLDMRTLYYLGAINVLRGRYFAALESLQKAETIAVQHMLVHWHAHIVAAKARVNLELGRLSEAKEFYFVAQSLYESVDAQADLPTLYTNMGRLFAREGNASQSIHYFDKAKAALPELTGQEHKLNLAQAEITALIVQGKYDVAYKMQMDLIALNQHSASEFFQGRNLSQLADIAVHQGNYSDALDYALKAIRLHSEKDDDLYYIKSNYLAALSSFKLNKPASQILTYLDSALTNIEVIRATLVRDDLRREYFSLQRALYDLKVQVHMASQAPDSTVKALLSAEAFKARTLYETFRRERKNSQLMSYAGLTPEQLLNVLLKEEQITLINPVTFLQPIDEAGLKKYQQQLTEQDAILYYFLGEDAAYVWLIQRNSVDVHSIQAGKEFAGVLKTVLSDLNHPPSPSSSATALRKEYQGRLNLSRILLEGVAEKLSTFKQLLIVPDGHLHQLPFIALLNPSSKTPLLNTHSVAYNLSLATDSWLRQLSAAPNQGGAMLVVANSEKASADSSLPSVSKEVATIASLWHQQKERTVTSLLDSNATKKNIAGVELSQYEIMHFASHAKVDWDYPELTAILLAPDQNDNSSQLTLNEITQWQLRAELVMLSACETAQGKLVGGEGSMGLSRAFFEAGAKRVVASFWPVEDTSTAYFMEQFYQSLLKNNKSPLHALQEAQQAVSRVPRWSHPYYWASMAYFGNREAWRE